MSSSGIFPASKEEAAFRWPPGKLRPHDCSDIKIQHELPGVRTEIEGEDLVLHLVVDPGLDDVRREDIALQKVFVIVLQCDENVSERPRSLGDRGQLLGRQVVDVLVQRLARVDLVLDSVHKGGHDHGRGFYPPFWKCKDGLIC
jgi:hypothetical protein